MQKVHAIEIILIAYWVIFTARKHFEPRLKKALVANAYDTASKRPGAQRAAQRKYKLLQAAGWGLRVAGWAENALLAISIAFFALMVGGLVGGTVIVFGREI